MKRLQKAALLTAFVEKLSKKGSWCGETHIQKATYFLQELLDVPTGFLFIFYKHGPFSFDLRDELTAMRADGLLELRPRSLPYGPSLIATQRGRSLETLYTHTLEQYDKKLDFVAEKLGDKGVADLEQLATALYVTMEQPDGNKNTKAKRIHGLKPHVSVKESKSAIETLDTIMREAEELDLE
jgi:uncharacterized protein YwgA